MKTTNHNLETRKGQFGDTIVEFTYNDKLYMIITSDLTNKEIEEEFLFENGNTDYNKNLISEVLTQLNK